MKKICLFLFLSLLVVSVCSCGPQQENASAEDASTDVSSKTEQEGQPKTEKDSTGEQVNEDKSENKGSEKYQSYNVISFESGDVSVDEWGFITSDIKITNNGDFTVALVSPVVDFLDKDGNILYTTYPQTQNNLRPGTYTTEEAIASSDDFDFSAFDKIAIENYSYYTVDGPEHFVDVNTVSMKADIYDAG